MRKLTALLLALVMVLALCVTASASDAESEPVTLSMSCFDTSGSFNDQMANYFMEAVQELSDGNISFTYYPNGSYCSMLEDYDFVSSGSLDCSWTYPGPNMPSIPWGYSAVSNVSMEDGMNLANYLYVDDPTCKAIQDKYGRINGALCLGTLQEGGCSVCIATFDFDEWSDLNSHKNGATRDQDMYASMGHNVVSLNQADLYDALSRGVCDFTVYNTASVLSNKLTEVAPYVFNTRAYGNALTYYINADKWDSLSAEQQGWITEAVNRTRAYSLEIGQQYQEDLKDNCTKWIDASDEDALYIGQNMEKSAAVLCLMFAENLQGEEGLEDMIYLLRVKEEWLGFDILPDEYASYRDTVQVEINK